MPIRISLKIDIKKIDRSRLFIGRNGAEYLDAIVFLNDTTDQYGNHGMIVQSVSKEERAQGVKGPILGNAKKFGESSNSGPRTAAAEQRRGRPTPAPAPVADDDSDPPF